MIHERFEELKLSGNLPSPAGVGLKILQLTRDENAGLPELVRAVQVDPALTGRILMLANSAAQAGIAPATSVEQAAVRLGTRAIRGVALGFTLISSSRAGACERFDYDGYWSSSLARAVVAQSIARRRGRCDETEAFTCGLLSRIGVLALASVHPKAYSRLLLEQAGATDHELALAEAKEFEIDRWQIAAAMMLEWGLPPAFHVAVVAFTPAPEGPGLIDPEIAEMHLVLRAADLLGGCLSAEAGAGARDPELDRLPAELGWASGEIAAVCEEALGRWREWCRLFRIPARAAPPAAPHERREPAPSGVAAACDAAAASQAAIRVLVVDDDPLIVRLLSSQLRRAGYEVLTATNGREGLELALDRAPEVIVTDWSMPELDGIELCRSLRRVESGRRTYVLLLTAREDEDRVVDAFAAGADDYVVKPFNPRILLARVQAGQRAIELQRQVEQERLVRMEQAAELGLLNRKLKIAAQTDVLTELRNRRYALTCLEQEWTAAAALERPLSLAMIDIDHFKRVNDLHGHDVGDHVLRACAAVLRAKTRRGDVVCRLGGEEFLVISPNCDLAAARACAERLRAAVAEQEIACGGFRGRVTISVGVAERRPEMRGADDLLRAVDRAVYQAKADGRDRVSDGAREEQREKRA